MSESAQDQPFFSVMIPAYNAEATLPETLDSVLAQGDDCAWEAVVVDDGSTDRTSEVVTAYARRDGRIRLFRQANGGTGAALNTALAQARGTFVAQLGSDDLLLPRYAITMSTFVRSHPGFDVYSCNAWLVDSCGNRKLYAEDAFDRQPVSMTLDTYLMGKPFLFAGGALIRRSVCVRLGGFRPEFYCEDVDFWARALAAGYRHIYWPEPLVEYRVGNPGQKTTDVVKKCEGTLAVYEDLLAHGQLTSVQRELVEEAIDRVRRLRDFEADAVRLRRVVEKLAGERHAEMTLAVLHKFTWTTRPFRRLLARLRAR